jgi:uncharacterized membrane protein
MTNSLDDAAVVERRLDRLTLVYAVAGAVICLAVAGWRAAGGLAVGAALSYLNFVWLKAGVKAIVARAVAGKDAPTNHGAGRFIARFFVLAAALCAIFFSHLVAFGAVLAGLFAVAGALMMEAGYRLWRVLSGAAV